MMTQMELLLATVLKEMDREISNVEKALSKLRGLQRRISNELHDMKYMKPGDAGWELKYGSSVPSIKVKVDCYGATPPA